MMKQGHRLHAAQSGEISRPDPVLNIVITIKIFLKKLLLILNPKFTIAAPHHFSHILLARNPFLPPFMFEIIGNSVSCRSNWVSPPPPAKYKTVPSSS